MNARRSVALVIRDPARPDRILLVQRPDDDDDLPGVWGLPAASLRDGEDWADAACRAARAKLGLEIETGRVLNEGSKQRAGYRLDMRLYEARIRDGTPRLDAAPADGTTRYTAWRWGPRAELEPAADRGSLCGRLALEAI